MSFIESLIAAKAAAGIAGAGSGGGYTDQVPVSTDADGSVFNGTGYQNDSYISSGTGGVSSQAGYVVTGFIPYAEGDVIRFKGAIWGEGSYSRIAFYDADKNKILVGTYPSSGEVADEGNGVYRLTPSVAEGGGKAFVRLSFYGTGENLVVTINEKIVSAVADWNTMKNKPFYEEVTQDALAIEWDGNMDGLVSVADMLFKVSDLVISNEIAKTCTLMTSSGDSFALADIWADLYVAENIVFFEGFAFVRQAGAEFDGAIFPETGVYFANFGDFYVSSLTSPELVEQTTIKTIDPKYLPDTVATKDDLEAAIGTAIGGSY